MSNLHIILGPMFAGKSTYLINTIQSLINNNSNSEEDKINIFNSILIINHSSDNRYSTESEICTHDNKKMPSLSLTKLGDIFKIDNLNIDSKTYIIIDEGQLFNDLYDSVKTLLIKYKKTIYIGGLDGDYKQEPFKDSRILDLIPYATSIIKLNAKCIDCNENAPFTKRLIYSDEQILVGGSESYKPVCLNHL